MGNDQKCFVIQPFDKGVYDQRYEEVFAPAIQASGLLPERVDKDPAVEVPIAAIESGIQRAAVCLADITTDNPNVWYEVGFAFAKSKPVCLVCWQERVAKYPFDIQHRKVEKYATNAQSDFEKAKLDITSRLKAMMESRQQLGAVEALQATAVTSGLTPHEIAVLVSVASWLGDPVPRTELKRLMDDAGFTSGAVGIAVTALTKRYMLEKAIGETDINGYAEIEFRLTDAGTQWLLENQASLALRKPPRKGRGWSTEDDIPF